MDLFCHFTSLTTQKIKILKNWKNHLEILYIILHMCTINEKHMMYGSWDIECDGCNCYFSFWTIFCPFTPLIAPKMKISKKRNKCLEMRSFYTSLPKIMTICYIVPEISRMTDVIVIFHFGLSFVLSPP